MVPLKFTMNHIQPFPFFNIDKCTHECIFVSYRWITEVLLCSNDAVMEGCLKFKNEEMFLQDLEDCDYDA